MKGAEIAGLKCPVFGLKCLNLTRHLRVKTTKITTLLVHGNGSSCPYSYAPTAPVASGVTVQEGLLRNMVYSTAWPLSVSCGAF
jgi:hypothetical protein